MAKRKDDGLYDENVFLDDPEAEIAEDEALTEDDAPTDPVEQLIAERDELKDRLLRALAETENIRKRAERDRRDAETYGGIRLARDMLSVHDNMGRALEAIDDGLRAQAASLVEGIELTKRELVDVFTKHKIEMVNPNVGDKFDPKEHQAMFEAPVADQPSGTIIQVMVPGFVIGERLLRPAQVGVSSGGVAAKPES